MVREHIFPRPRRERQARPETTTLVVVTHTMREDVHHSRPALLGSQTEEHLPEPATSYFAGNRFEKTLPVNPRRCHIYLPKWATFFDQYLPSRWPPNDHRIKLSISDELVDEGLAVGILDVTADMKDRHRRVDPMNEIE